jgi:hypothetical protein
MPNEAKIQSNTGNAKITKVGHTATTAYGSNPDAKRKGNLTVRDLSAKS